MVQFVRIVSTSEDSALLSWSAPPYSGLHIIEYQIQYRKGSGDVIAVDTKQLSYKLKSLVPHVTYIVQVSS